MFVYHISNKGLMSRIYLELLQFKNKKANNPMKKWVENSNRYFSKEDRQMASTYLKRCSTSIILKEMQIKIKTTMWYHSIHISISSDRSLSRVWIGDPMDYSLPDSSVHGILQAILQEQVAISSTRGSSGPRDRIHVSCVSCIGRQIPYDCDT